MMILFALAALAVTALSFQMGATVGSPILDRPVNFGSPGTVSGHFDSLPERWRKVADKFHHDRPFVSLADVLHHVGNALTQGNDERQVLLSDLLDGKLLPSRYQPKTLWLFRGIDRRPHVSQGKDPGCEAHPGQLLCELAAFGIPSSRIVRSGDEEASVKELIQSLREDFHLEGEIEWKSMAMTRYAPSKSPWTNRWGQTFDFDTIVASLLRRAPGEGSCRGSHVLQALVVIWRVDASFPILSPSSRASIFDRLKVTIERLKSSQRPSGYWAPDWAYPHPNRDDYDRDLSLFDEEDLAVVTGHHLEWIELLDDRLPFPESSRRAAAAWCGRLLERVTTQTIASSYCAYSHCFRAVNREVFSNSWRE